MNVVRAQDLIGLPVVSIGSGEALAEIRDVVYDGEEHVLVGFTLNSPGLLARRLSSVLAAASVAAIGPDAVMVSDDSAVRDGPDGGHRAEGDSSGGDDERDGNAEATGPTDLRGARPVLGNRVLSGDGIDLGEVVAVVLATADTPRAVGYEVSTSDRGTAYVPISSQIALSGENLLLQAGTDDLVETDLAGFAATLDSHQGSGEGAGTADENREEQ
jgi:sporulation protein YlmC with PRC-barrel domain